MSDKKALVVLIIDHDTYTAEATGTPDMPLDREVLLSFGRQANDVAANWLGYEAWMVIADVPEAVLAELSNRNIPIDAHGTIHPEWNGSNENRFKLWVRGHEPDEEDGWRYKLEVVDTKYQDSDNYPISSIAGGNSWTEAFQTAQHFVETALKSDHCIF